MIASGHRITPARGNRESSDGRDEDAQIEVYSGFSSRTKIHSLQPVAGYFFSGTT